MVILCAIFVPTSVLDSMETMTTKVNIYNFDYQRNLIFVEDPIIEIFHMITFQWARLVKQNADYLA